MKKIKLFRRRIITLSIILILLGVNITTNINAIDNEPNKEENEKPSMNILDPNKEENEKPSMNILDPNKEEDTKFIHINQSFIIPSIETKIISDKTFSQIKISDITNFGKSGEPSIPVRSIKVLLPPGGRIINVQFNGNKQNISLKYPLLPGFPPINEYINETVEDMLNYSGLDKSIYNSSSTFPGELYNVSYVGDVSGFTIAYIHFYPVQYIPTEKKIYFYSRMNLTIETIRGGISGCYRGFSFDKEKIESYAINPSMTKEYPTSTKRGTNYDYIIITSNDYLEIFQTLADYKSQFNIKTKVVSIEDDIENNQSFSVNGEWGDNNPSNPFYEDPIDPDELEHFDDLSARIRNYIRYAYWELSANYILLGGNSNVVPAREFFGKIRMNIHGWHFPDDVHIPADIYYSALEGTWNDYTKKELIGEDHGNIWGEYRFNLLGQIKTRDQDWDDYYSTLYVGRAPIDEVDEAETFVKKVISYETMEKPHKITLHGQDDVTSGQGAGTEFKKVAYDPDSTNDCFDKIIQHTDWEQNDINLFIEDENYENNDPYITKNDWADEFNDNRLIVQQAGHGAYRNYTLNYDPTKIIFDTYDITTLLNNDFFPIHTSLACFLGKFTIYPECFSSRLLVKEDGGASACIANAGKGWQSWSDQKKYSGEIMIKQFDLIFDDRLDHLGMVHQDAKERYVLNEDPYGAYKHVYHGLNLLGDPEMPVLEKRDLTVYVNKTYDSSKPGFGILYFNNIQDAIDAVHDTATILVDTGTYNENLVIDKQITIRGQSREGTIIDGGGTSDVVQILSDTVEIYGFTIQNSGSSTSGIYIDNSDYITISDVNISTNNGNGIQLSNSDNNQISDSYIVSNTLTGIKLGYSNGNIIVHNIINCNDEGLNITSESDNNLIYLNDFNNSINQAWDECSNTWSNPDPENKKGNYWIDYTGTDVHGDGIGDTPYNISGGSNQDDYPLMTSTVLHPLPEDFETYPYVPPTGWNVYQTGAPSDGWKDGEVSASDGSHCAFHNDTQAGEGNRNQSRLWQDPVAIFDWSPEYPDVGETVTFDGSDSYDPDLFGWITTWAWDFEDDGWYDAWGEIVTHVYDSPGVYTVKLWVQDNTGRSDSVRHDVYVGQDPFPDFTWSPQYPSVEETITFDASASYDPDGSIVNYTWDFENDGIDDAWGEIVTHAYSLEGIYDVKLLIKDDDSNTNFKIKTIQIGNENPVVDFIWSPEYPDPGPGTPELVTFDASASYDPDGSIVNYTWDFENDGIDDAWGEIVTHAYDEFGMYSVKLIIKDNDDATNISYKPIFVGVEDWLVTPLIKLSNYPIFTFYEKNNYVPSWYGYHGVWISEGSMSPADGDYVELQEFNQDTSSWTKRTIDLGGYSGKAVYIAFKYQGDYDSEWFIDDVNIINSLPPYKPTIPSGINSGLPGVLYDYSTSTTDFENDDIYYFFDWDDNSNTGWLGPYQSGEQVTIGHQWNQPGIYNVKVKAKDEYHESGWSDNLKVTIGLSLLSTSFENSWIDDDPDGDNYLIPDTGWDVDGECNSSQSGYPNATHYWSQYDNRWYQLSKNGDYSAGLWWSDGNGGDNYQNEWIISPPLNCTKYYNVYLSFYGIWKWEATRQNDSLKPSDMDIFNGSNNRGTDHNYVKISTDNGNTWTIIADLLHDSQYEQGTGGPGGYGWCWNEYKVMINISDYTDGNSSVLIAWQAVDDGGSTLNSIFMIDDVAIAGMEKKVKNVNTGIYYRTIQAAIDAPETQDSHVIEVDSDVYNENLIVNKLLTITGNDKYTTIINGSGTGDVISILSDSVTIKNFTIQNSGNPSSGHYAGIHLSADNIKIMNSLIQQNDIGIEIGSHIDNIIENNVIEANINDGIRLNGAFNNISYNMITDNGNLGVHICYLSNNNTFYSNNIFNNWIGLQFCYMTENNTIHNNDISGNVKYGINFEDPYNKYNTIKGNIMTENGYNGGYGIKITENNDNNLIYNNYFDNTNNAIDDNNYNIWNISNPLQDTNIIGGNYIAGNYWSNYNGFDRDGDSIGDTDLPYNCSGNIQNGGDYMPLTFNTPPPDIWVNPEKINTSVPEGTISETNITIGNSGLGIGEIGKLNYTIESIILYEDFDFDYLENWSEMKYSGTGEWEISQTSYYSPYNHSGGFLIADSDAHSDDVYDTEMFTPSMDFSGKTNVTIHCGRNFQDYAGDGEAHIATYSGGIGSSYQEEQLWWQTEDDPYEGVDTYLYFDPSMYNNPNEVYVGFWYSTNGGTYAWSFAIDDLEIYETQSQVIYLEEDFNSSQKFPPEGWTLIQNTTEINYYPCFWDYIGYSYHSSPTSAGLWWGYESQDEWFITPPLNFSLLTDVELSFWTYNYGQYSGYWEEDLVKISIDNGSSWTTLDNMHTAVDPYPGGNFFDYPMIYNLSSYADQQNVKIAFHRYSLAGENLGVWFIDDVKIQGNPSWFTLSETNGSVDGGDETDITLTFNATELDVGTYNVSMLVISNDPDENPVTIPVCLNVTLAEANNPPVISSPSPYNGETGVSVDLTQLSAIIEDPEGDSFDWSIETSPNVGSSSGSGENNGTKICPVSGLSYSTTYTWYVNATDPSKGSGERTNETYNFTTRNKYIPSPPSGFTATASATDQIALCWTMGTDADKTYIEWNTAEDWNMGDGNFMYNITGTGTSHTGLSAHTTYYYQAWSWNETDSVYSSSYAEDDGTTFNTAPSYGTPSPANGSTGNDLSLIWSIMISDADGDGFDWDIECSNGQSSGSTDDSNGTKELDLSGLADNMEYIVWVNASDGYDITSEWFTFTTRALFEPGIPGSFTATASATDEIDLSWTLGSDADKTYVEWNTDSGWNMGDGTEIYNDTGTSTSHTGLSAHTTYYYQAWSWNETDSIYSSSYAEDDNTTFNTTYYLSLYTGWNLITVPVNMSWNASDLANNISGCLYVTKYDGFAQEAWTYTGNPASDFMIIDGYGYLVYTTQDSLFSVCNEPITNVSIPIYAGWNMIGWYHDSEINASDLADSIPGCLYVTKYDGFAQEAWTYTGNPASDFVISQSMGVLIYATESSIWYGYS